LFHIPVVGYHVSQIFYFCFDSCRIDGVVHVLKHYSVGAIFFRFVCMEPCTFLSQGFDNCPIRVRGCWLGLSFHTYVGGETCSSSWRSGGIVVTSCM
jgi:hypothetical protein